MIKRLRKFKKSKQGAILVVVVLILALAMIFISAAMMLTQATRSRLYKNTMSSQARLTVTTAAEVFLEALETQEITDAQLDAMLKADSTGQQHHELNQRIKMVVNGVPGMQGVDGNCTYLDLYYPNTSNKKIVYADFTTVIGDETENVRAVLRVDKKNSNLGGRFSNQIEIAGAADTSELRFTAGVGMYDKTKFTKNPDDNTILMRSSPHEQTSGGTFFSRLVFGGSTVAGGINTDLGGGNYYYGDLVFLGDATLGSYSGIGAATGNIFFVGETDRNAFYDNGEQYGFFDDAEPGAIVFAGNRTVYIGGTATDPALDNNTKIGGFMSDHTCYFVNDSGETTGTATYKYKVKDAGGNKKDVEITNAADGDDAIIPDVVTDTVTFFSDSEGGYNVGTFPSDVEALFADITLGSLIAPEGGITLSYDTVSADGKTTYPAGTKIPEGADYVPPLTTSFPDYATQNKIYIDSLGTTKFKELDPGFYYITSTSEATTVTSASTRSKNDSPYIFAIDGSQAENYRFYFEGGKTFNLNNVIFAMYNVSSDTKTHSVIFVMEQDAKVLINDANFRLADDNSEKILCTGGFLSMPRAGTAADLKTYLTSTKYTEEAKVWSTDYIAHDDGTQYVIQYSRFYDGENRPAMFIYGVGGNLFQLGDSTMLEAYVGLYNESSFGIREGTANYAKDKAYPRYIPIYGRIEATGFSNGDDGDHPLGNVQMPYCPQPKADDNLPPKRTAGSKYKVYDVIYYYEIPTADEDDE
jgi:hypothetical protein